eukprot:TRINITY_DN8838_c0_g1_i1.p1 TRINITY_DN8838_c0_g1~~TRINITY_DN8838_c0_g1_i1.p1  ORF type:complete len:348 (+),score=110.50 TRINITY_DN8838_c0_g1_i1:54-1046(+)
MAFAQFPPVSQIGSAQFTPQFASQFQAPQSFSFQQFPQSFVQPATTTVQAAPTAVAAPVVQETSVVAPAPAAPVQYSPAAAVAPVTQYAAAPAAQYAPAVQYAPAPAAPVAVQGEQAPVAQYAAAPAAQYAPAVQYAPAAPAAPVAVQAEQAPTAQHAPVPAAQYAPAVQYAAQAPVQYAPQPAPVQTAVVGYQPVLAAPLNQPTPATQYESVQPMYPVPHKVAPALNNPTPRDQRQPLAVMDPLTLAAHTPVQPTYSYAGALSGSEHFAQQTIQPYGAAPAPDAPMFNHYAALPESYFQTEKFNAMFDRLTEKGKRAAQKKPVPKKSKK